MKFESIDGWDDRANGTCLRGYLTGTYNDLVDAFGPPMAGCDEYKTDAEWILIFNTPAEEEVVVTIYNYKSGKNYLGADGLQVRDIENWHIGGKSNEAVWALDDYVDLNGLHLKVNTSRF